MPNKPKIITVTNFKGGVGKTNICLNLGYTLAQRGNRVLLIDLDPQGNLSHFLRHPDQNQEHTSIKRLSLESGKSIANVLAPHELGIETHTLREVMYPTVWENVFCVPANLSLQRVKDAVLQNPHVLKFAINTLNDGDDIFDYVLIDTHPDLDIKVTNAIVAADFAIIPVRFDGVFVEGLRETIDAIERTTADLRVPLSMEPVKYRAVANAVDERTGRDKAGQQILTSLLDFNDRFQTVVPDTCKVGEASMRGLSVAELPERTGSAKAVAAFEELTDELQNWCKEGELIDR